MNEDDHLHSGGTAASSVVLEMGYLLDAFTLHEHRESGKRMTENQLIFSRHFFVLLD
jgi:hypothetical protein